MSSKFRLSRKELIELIEATEAAGNDATELKNLLAEVEQGQPAKQINDEGYIAELRGQSSVERGIDLECMICRDKFDRLVSGTCEACFRKWMLSTKKR